MARVIVFATVVVGLLSGGCAFTPANLDVAYDSSKAKAGPLSSIKPLKIDVGNFVDKRPQADKIGYKRNNFGAQTANVLTTRPVPEIVRGAVVAAFNKNGHIVTSGEKDVSVSGTIETFWFESQINFWTIEFMGTVDVNLVVADGRTGQTMLCKRYTGHHNEAFAAAYHKEMADVMNKALANLIDQISGDAKLIEVLRSQSGSSAISTEYRP